MNGTVSVTQRGLERSVSGKDREGYSSAVLLYLRWLVDRYGPFVPDTDFLWHFHDVKLGQIMERKLFSWTLNDSIPYFFTDAELTWQHNDNAAHILLGVSRNFMKYRHFAEHVFSDWKSSGHRLRRKGDRVKGSMLNFSNLQVGRAREFAFDF